MGKKKRRLRLRFEIPLIRKWLGGNLLYTFKEETTYILVFYDIIIY